MKKKKYLGIIVSVMMLMLIFTFAASAADNTHKSGVFTYTVTDGEATITDCDTSVEGHIVIPETLDDYPVTAIAERAFYECKDIRDVTIPESIKHIGDYAFSYTLENVYVDSMDFWYNITFEGENSNPMRPAEKFYVAGELLTELVIPEGITVLQDYVFWGCDSLASVTLPKSLKVLGESGFAYCDSLKSVYADSVEWWISLYENTTATGKEVYLCSPVSGYTNLYLGGELLVDLVIPESITRLPEQTFSYVSTIESITFHKDFEEIGGGAFSLCRDTLKEVYVPDLKVWFNICDSIRSIFSSGKTIETIYINNEPVEDLIIPEDIDVIVDYAFINYKKLKSVTFTKPVNRIGISSFSGCDSFKSVYVDSFETWNSFDTDYTDYNILKAVDYLYIDGEPVVDLVIPEGVKTIRKYAFVGYKALKSVTIPASVEYIGKNAFNSFNLENVYVESIEAWLNLSAAMQKTAVEISGWNPMMYGDNFYVGGELLVDLVIPQDYNVIPAGAFYNVKSIKSITLFSGNVEFESNIGIETLYLPDIASWFGLSIGSKLAISSALKNLYIDGELLTEYTFPEGITEIPAYAFYGYDGLESVTIPSTVEHIGKSAFSGCNGLVSINVEPALKSIGDDAFLGCAIESVYATSLEHWLSIDFSNSYSNPLCYKTSLYFDGEILEELRVPEHIGEIKNYAFIRYTKLERFDISGSPLEIGYKAFASNVKIYAQSIEDWFTVKFDSYLCNPMGSGATLYIAGKQPEEIVIPESIEKIPDYAFQNCNSLKKITIPATTRIGEYVFRDCEIKEFVIGSLTEEIEPVAVIGSTAFEGFNTLEKITFGFGVKKIGDKAFCEHSNLKEVVFYSGLVEIGEKAFYKTSVASVTIPSTVKRIGASAFANCKALTELTLGDTVGQKSAIDIEDYAFSSCTKLEKVTINTAGGKMGEKVFEKAQRLKDVYINDLTLYLGMEFLTVEGGLQSNPVSYAENVYVNGKIAQDIVIPEGVTGICDYAFYRCGTLETVRFPSTLVKIGEHAFASTNIKDFSMPESVEIIGNAAFMSCKSLTTVELKANVKEVGMGAFDYCTGLKIVYMYPELLNIGESAFGECENIEVILYAGTEEAWNKLLSQNKNSGLKGVAVFYSFRSESMNPTEKIEAVQITADTINLLWTKVDGVTGYRVYVRNGNNWDTMKTLKENTYKVTGLNSGTKYTFAVKAYISQGAFVLWSPEYTTISATTKAHKLTTLKAVAPTCTKTGLTEGKRCTICGTVTVVQKTVAKKAHTYKTVATKAKISKNGKVENKCTVCGYVLKTTIVYYPKTIKLSKTAYTYDGKVKAPTVTVKDSEGKKLKNGTDYKITYESGRKLPGKYTVRIDFMGKYSGTKRLYFTIAPKVTSKVKASQTTSTITLKWNKVTGATGYRVYQYNTKTKKYESIKTLTGTSLKVSKLKAGTSYKFKIKAYKKDDGTIWGSATSAITVATKPVTPKITKLTTTKGKAVFTWSNVSGESGYQVYYSTKKDGDFKKVATYKANVVKGSKSKLKSGKKYYFKVRAYKTVGDAKVYSAWSAVKSIKIK